MGAMGQLTLRRKTKDEMLAEINNAVARGLAIVTRRIAALPLTRSGVPVKLTALCFDGGWRTAAVSAFCRAFQAPFSLIHSKGFNWRYYAPSDKIARPANHCHLSEAEYGRFLAIHADYWREYAHRALLSEPLQYGSLSFYGTDPKAHAQLAEEICAEIPRKPFWRRGLFALRRCRVVPTP